MKNTFLYIFLFGIAASNIFAQTPETGASTRIDRGELLRSTLKQKPLEEEQKRQDKFNRSTMKITYPGRVAALENLALLYHKTTDKELKLLAPNVEDLAKFKIFLQQPDTGIFKLAADIGCSDDTNILVATPDCLDYTMSGGGNSYSFRMKDYRLRRLADINFTNSSFQASGVFLHGFFAELGDIPLEQVNLQTKGVEFAAAFKPEPNFEKAKEIDSQLANGISENGFSYRRAVAAKDDTTYILRSIAYKRKFSRYVDGLTYDEMHYDKRKDVLIAFRVIRRDDNGSLTVVWKQLRSQSSPKTKF